MINPCCSLLYRKTPHFRLTRYSSCIIVGAVALLSVATLLADVPQPVGPELSSGGPSPTNLAEGFRNPPDAAEPWAYWWWLNGHVTREGITRDLEEMKRQGINGVLIFHAGGAAGPMPQGPAFLSSEWMNLFRHAVREAGRLGMEVSVNLCDGWDAGGPWIAPEAANKKLVCSEFQADGPRRLICRLPAPPVLGDYYRDVAVVAFREKATHRPVTPAQVTASSSWRGYCREMNRPPSDLMDRDPETFWRAQPGVQPSPDSPVWVDLRYHTPLAAEALLVVPADRNGPRECALQAQDENGDFKTVARFAMERGERIRVSFPQTRATHYRLTFTSAYSRDLRLAEIWLLREGDKPSLRRGVKWWKFKSGNRSFWDWPPEGPWVLNDRYPDQQGAYDCRSEEVLDLTRHMDPEGTLEWDVPEGRWTILRFGYTLQGQRTRCGVTTGGYEADMLSPRGIECHFENTAIPLLEALKGRERENVKFLHIDSYELGADVAGQQPTWSHVFRREFKARRGYDLLPYLPVMARRIVDSREKSNRFLWDFRRTIADLMADTFFRRFAELGHNYGVGVHCETGYGTYPYPHIDGLQCAGMSDVTMGEFWHSTDIMSQHNNFGNVIRTVASAAHLYGRKIVQAEAFTSWNHFLESPATLKPVGDDAFCQGLNRMVFHQYTHQPELRGKPGFQYGAGTHIDRKLTWWGQADAFLRYLARCHYLLRQGRFAADVCYFYGEGSAIYVPSRQHLKPELPAGYNFDMINADGLLNRLSVRDGRLVLPDGLSYRVLVLPRERKMSPGVLRRVRDLVQAGATVVGPPPERAPGLTGFPQCDQKVRQIADALWGEVDGVLLKQRTVGPGQIVWGASLKEVLADLDVPPDLEVRGNDDVTHIEFIHRTTEAADIYFLSNQKRRAERVDCIFRAASGRPELWDPVSGEMRVLPEFRREDGRTVVPLEFAPYQSYFIVFREGSDDRPAESDTNFPHPDTVVRLEGPWTVNFDPEWGGPEEVVFEELTDWTRRPEEGIKYYSGTATYHKEFDLAERARASERMWLDLGEVKNIAEVRLNGQDLGVVWTAPWRVQITDAVKRAGNRLEIDVVNLWPNRLIGDGRLPPEERYTKTNVGKFYKGEHKLLESGLLGPVTLRVEGKK